MSCILFLNNVANKTVITYIIFYRAVVASNPHGVGAPTPSPKDPAAIRNQRQSPAHLTAVPKKRPYN